MASHNSRENSNDPIRPRVCCMSKLICGKGVPLKVQRS